MSSEKHSSKYSRRYKPSLPLALHIINRRDDSRESDKKSSRRYERDDKDKYRSDKEKYRDNDRDRRDNFRDRRDSNGNGRDNFRSNFSSNRPQKSMSDGMAGANLQKINWGQYDLSSFTKDFYKVYIL